MRRRAVPLGAAVTAGLLVAGCGPPGPITTHEEGVAAIVDSFDGSWSWETRLVTDVDEDALAQLERFERDLLEQWRDAEDSAAVGAWAQDGSVRSALIEDGEAYLDLRVGLRELLRAETLTPEAHVYLAVDVLHLARDLGAGPLALDVWRTQAERWLEGSPLAEVVVALFDGAWVGVSGTLDLEGLGVSRDEFEDVREQLRAVTSLTDRAVLREVLDRAVRLRELGRAPGGGTSAVVDVHPRAAAATIIDRIETAQRSAGLPPPDVPDLAELPETLEGVARIAFDRDGRLVEVIVDVVAIVRQLDAAELSTPVREMGLGGLADLPADTTLEIVTRFADHGQLDTVLDVPAPVTIGWDELGAAFRDLWVQSVEEAFGDERHVELDGLHDELHVEIEGTGQVEVEELEIIEPD